MLELFGDKPSLGAIPENPLTPSDVGELMRALCESAFPYATWILGEVKDLTHHSSGHIYFTLRDAGAVLRAVMWKGSVARGGAQHLKEGTTCICRGEISVYGKSSVYQLMVDRVMPYGEGEATAKRREVYRRLSAEGLFQQERKRRLPASPGRVGIVTSPTGAVLQDFLRIARRRNPAIRIIISPCRVQGAEAVGELLVALSALQGLADVVVLARGGGSSEDLSPFDDEGLVRAVAAYPVPVIVAVGHEIDHPLVENAADLVASTPSAAAEMAVPLAREHAEYLAEKVDHLHSAINTVMHNLRQRFEDSLRGLSDRRLSYEAKSARQTLDGLHARLRAQSPDRVALPAARSRMAELGGRLRSLSPREVLARGFVLVENETGDIRMRASEVIDGENLNLLFIDGKRRVKASGGEVE